MNAEKLQKKIEEYKNKHNGSLNGDTCNDLWIIKEVFKGYRDGFFVEAGAMGGIFSSCTYELEKDYGWTGILVEPNADLFEELKINRPNSACLDVCLTDGKEESVTYTQFTKYDGSPRGGHDGHSGLMGIWDEKRLKKCKDWSQKTYQRTAKSLQDVLEENNAPKVIDYLALDIERSEQYFVDSFPFDKYKFKAMSLEGGSLLRQDGVRLRENGYIPVPNTRVNLESSSWYADTYWIHKDFLNIEYKV